MFFTNLLTAIFHTNNRATGAGATTRAQIPLF